MCRATITAPPATSLNRYPWFSERDAHPIHNTGGQVKVATRGVAVAISALVVALGAAACSSSGTGGAANTNGNSTPPPASTGSDAAPSSGAPSSSGGNNPNGLKTQDINAQPVSALKQGGTVVWGLDQYSTQWNYNQVDGPESSTANVINALMPTPFIADAKAVTNPDPDYVTSATQTSTSPQTIELKLNPKAKWSDGYADHRGRLRGAMEGAQRQEQGVPGRQHDRVRPDRQRQGGFGRQVRRRLHLQQAVLGLEGAVQPAVPGALQQHAGTVQQRVQERHPGYCRSVR